MESRPTQAGKASAGSAESTTGRSRRRLLNRHRG